MDSVQNNAVYFGFYQSFPLLKAGSISAGVLFMIQRWFVNLLVEVGLSVLWVEAWRPFKEGDSSSLGEAWLYSLYHLVHLNKAGSTSVV